MSSSGTELFPPQIEAYRNRIDVCLDEYTQLDAGSPLYLTEAIRYCLLAPGKRVRPLLVLTANELCGGNIESAMPAACAVEMIHNYSLIHDDLPAMDDDDVRRGRPTCHIQFDEATAILAGDSLIPLAFEVIARDTYPAQTAVECVTILAKAAGATKLVGGQSDDLNLQNTLPNLDDLEKIHRRKTGALLSASLELGAVTAGATTDQRQNLINYGKHIGLAFQIVDDLLDLKGSQAKMGKRTGKDADRGKMTYPALLGVEESETRAREMTEAALATLQSFSDCQAKQALEILAHFVVNRTQ